MNKLKKVKKLEEIIEETYEVNNEVYAEAVEQVYQNKANRLNDEA